MSIEKFNPKISGETIPYTMVHTNVVQQISDPVAGFIWIYLLTLPPDWIVVKEHIKTKFNIGDNKIKRIFSYLKSCNLIEYVQGKLPSGKFIKSEIRILNGSKFKNITPKVIHKTGGMETAPPENRSSGFGALQSKQDTNEIKKQNKHLCPLESSGLDKFEEFYKSYPRKEGKKSAEKAWNKNKLYEIADHIISSVKKRTELDYKLRDKKHIPLPATYLNGELWQDEITPKSEEKIVTNWKNVVNNELKSTVPEWGPGHPGWEEINGFDVKHREQLLNAAAQGSGAKELLEKAFKQRTGKASHDLIHSSVPKAEDYIPF